MSFTVQKFPDEPIILWAMGEDYDVPGETPSAVEQLLELLEAADSAAYLVVNLLELRFKFGDMVGVLGQITRGDTAVLHHPNLKEVVVLTASDLAAIGARALRQAQYGNVRASIFGTLDEALAHVRSQVAQQAA